MTRTASTVRWMIGTAVVCLVVLLGSWLLLLEPMLDDAAASRDQAVQTRAQNAALTGNLAALEAEFAGIDAYRAELSELRRQLPSDAELTALSREIHAAAAGADVQLVGIEVLESLDMTAAAAAGGTAPAPGEVAPDTAIGEAEPVATDVLPGAPVTAPPVEGMIAIPLTATAAGSVDGVRAFLRALQTGLDRQLHVASLRITALEPSDGSDGARASVAGDIRAAIGAFAYVLPTSDGVAVGGASDGAGDTGALPLASTGTPFLPADADVAVEPEVPAPDPATVVADSIAAALEERLAAATAASQAQADASAAAAQAAAAAAEAAAADAAAGAPVPVGPDVGLDG